MRKERRFTTTSPRAYQLPEDGYEALLRSRDNLRLLANLTAPSRKDFDKPALTCLALARCFHRVADELDAVVRAGWWPELRAPGDR